MRPSIRASSAKPVTIREERRVREHEAEAEQQDREGKRPSTRMRRLTLMIEAFRGQENVER